MVEGTIEQIYQKKTQLEHILLRPDTYIGSVEHDKQQLWVYNKETDKIEFRTIDFVPGLYKIFGKFKLAANFYQMRFWLMLLTTFKGTRP